MSEIVSMRSINFEFSSNCYQLDGDDYDAIEKQKKLGSVYFEVKDGNCADLDYIE